MAAVSSYSSPSLLRCPLPSGQEVRLSEVLSSLSLALDLTEGQPEGHTVRTCALAVRMAEALGLSDGERSALYYAALLKDAGCSANSAATAEMFGTDEHQVKRELKTVQWDRQLQAAQYVFRTAAVGKGLWARAGHVLKVATAPGGARQMFRIRCERGAEIAGRLGFPEGTAQAIRGLDEHWDGAGYPHGWRGEEIPLLGRILGLAQTLEVFVAEAGAGAALEVMRERSGTWFDPALVSIVETWRNDRSWWAWLRELPAMELAARLSPPDQVRILDDAGLDTVAQAYADIIDAKSPFTYRHSSSVARYAGEIARTLALEPEAQRQLHRAGLLHDIGKLGVPNTILDKPGALTTDERQSMQRHPVHTREILSRVSAFRSFSWIAATHHERVDGRGYPWNVPGEQLTLSARILAVADVYDALTAHRPYRAGMPVEQALGILRKGMGTHLDPQAVSALEQSASNATPGCARCH